ncbi:hypothetical protein EDD18DRAFT_866130 [Armillaria luteobubalina]|uniref:Uncharacterized protein n=1 Tax=Armillaria luteobubalina TaxID=153913 RepID=A0AA39QBN4_9AGAR|nr:hypothetical protein EDD18DRAFT_866130 [Armillaria luteobubalina]
MLGRCSCCGTFPSVERAKRTQLGPYSVRRKTTLSCTLLHLDCLTTMQVTGGEFICHRRVPHVFRLTSDIAYSLKTRKRRNFFTGVMHEAEKYPDLQFHTCRFSVNNITPPHGAFLIAALYRCRQCLGLADSDARHGHDGVQAYPHVYLLEPQHCRLTPMREPHANESVSGTEPSEPLGYTDVDVKVASRFDTETTAVALSSNDLHTPQMFGLPP